MYINCSFVRSIVRPFVSLYCMYVQQREAFLELRNGDYKAWREALEKYLIPAVVDALAP